MVLIFNLMFTITTGKRVIKTYNYDRVISKDNVKIFSKGKRPHIFLPQRYKLWESEIKRQAKEQLPKDYIPTKNEINLTIEFYLKDKRCPDLQNLPKSVCDALNGVVWEDDRQISEVHLFRKFGYEKSKIVLIFEEINAEKT